VASVRRYGRCACDHDYRGAIAGLAGGARGPCRPGHGPRHGHVGHRRSVASTQARCGEHRAHQHRSVHRKSFGRDVAWHGGLQDIGEASGAIVKAQPALDQGRHQGCAAPCGGEHNDEIEPNSTRSMPSMSRSRAVPRRGDRVDRAGGCRSGRRRGDHPDASGRRAGHGDGRANADRGGPITSAEGEPGDKSAKQHRAAHRRWRRRRHSVRARAAAKRPARSAERSRPSLARPCRPAPRRVRRHVSDLECRRTGGN
jgi:hypothetical protein